MNKKLHVFIATLTIELFQVHMTLAKSGGGKTSDLLNALHPGKEWWRINTGIVEHSTMHYFKFLVSLWFVTACNIILNFSMFQAMEIFMITSGNKLQRNQ